MGRSCPAPGWVVRARRGSFEPRRGSFEPRRGSFGIIRRVGIARTALAAFALLACAWFALAARQAHEINAASALLSGGGALSAAQAREADALLSSAATLNPDRQVDVLRAQVALARGDQRRARSILEPVVRQEPDNLSAWVQYARASTHDPVAFYTAEIAIRRLVRVFPPPR
jgi:hypothetical protein